MTGDQRPKETSLFLVPRSSTAWLGNEAVWIAVAGWASAGQQLFGQAHVGTSDAIFTPGETRQLPRLASKQMTSGKSRYGAIRELVPEVFITAWKDIRLRASLPSKWPADRLIESETKVVKLIWERHDLFPGPGRRLADKLKVPLITSVDGPVVWEARKWGVRRPVWGPVLELRSEAASLKRSDLVACVSEQVREKVLEMGVEESNTMVVDNGVDSTLFHPGVNGERIRRQFDLSGKFVIGWTGSFKSFHGLEIVLDAFARIHSDFPGAVLMLVGDGPGFQAIKELSREKNISDAVLMPGRQSFDMVPEFVAAFDVALVSAPADGAFHYSPLKLREYLSLGRPVVAPRAGDIPRLFRDGTDLLLFDPSDDLDLANKLSLLIKDASLRGRLMAQALELFERKGTWASQLMRICDRVGVSYNKT